MNIAIVGSRNFNNYELLKSVIMNKINIIAIKKIISGGAKGTDFLAKKFADEYNIKKDIYYPKWQLYGKSAGIIRNKIIVKHSDFIFAFWDGESKGTKYLIKTAKVLNKNIFIHIF